MWNMDELEIMTDEKDDDTRAKPNAALVPIIMLPLATNLCLLSLSPSKPLLDYYHIWNL